MILELPTQIFYLQNIYFDSYTYFLWLAMIIITNTCIALHITDKEDDS